jgi:hypothetical protein
VRQGGVQVPQPAAWSAPQPTPPPSPQPPPQRQAPPPPARPTAAGPPAHSSGPAPGLLDLEIQDRDLEAQFPIDFSSREEHGLVTIDLPPKREDPWARSRVGPVGTIRDPQQVVVLHLATLGLYYLRWIHQTYREAHRHADGRREVRIPDGGPAAAVFALVPFLAAALGTVLILATDPWNRPPWMTDTLTYVVPFLGLPFAAAGWIFTAGLVTRMRVASGVRRRDAGNTRKDALWLLVPVVGALVFCAKVQGRLNRYWRYEAEPQIE